MAEETRLDQHGQYLPMLYDDLLRKQLAGWAESRDPLLNIEDELQKPNRTILTAAQTRLAAVVQAAGLQKSGANPGAAAAGAGNAMAESIMAKHEAPPKSTCSVWAQSGWGGSLTMSPMGGAQRPVARSD